MNNLEKFYDKKELYKRFEKDKRECHKHFINIEVSANQVNVSVDHRISSELKYEQKEYIVNLIKQCINEKQKDIEEKIMGELALDESNAANQVINDLKLRDIVWIKQEVD